jgi:Flp pilus assembly CpaF family ATPase
MDSPVKDVSLSPEPITLKIALDRTIRPYLDQKNIENININKPKEVWIEYAGGKREKFSAPALTKENLINLAKEIATSEGMVFDDIEVPLSTKLKDGSRVEVFASSCVPSHFSLSVRKRKNGQFSLLNFGLCGEQIKKVKTLVEERKCFIVSGGTSSGKTTVLEQLCSYIEQERRLITIQDPEEINFKQPNILGLTLSAIDFEERQKQLTYISATAMRQNPDSVIFGEIREKYMAYTFKMLLNTGHAGSMATLHADSPLLAIKRLASLVHQQENGDIRLIEADLIETIDYVIHVEKTHEGRFARLFDIKKREYINV